MMFGKEIPHLRLFSQGFTLLRNKETKRLNISGIGLIQSECGIFLGGVGSLSGRRGYYGIWMPSFWKVMHQLRWWLLYGTPFWKVFHPWLISETATLSFYIYSLPLRHQAKLCVSLLLREVGSRLSPSGTKHQKRREKTTRNSRIFGGKNPSVKPKIQRKCCFPADFSSVMHITGEFLFIMLFWKIRRKCILPAFLFKKIKKIIP